MNRSHSSMVSGGVVLQNNNQEAAVEAATTSIIGNSSYSRLVDSIASASCSSKSALNRNRERGVKLTSYSKMDILSGRGGLANKHTGNRVFRRLIKQNKEQYRGLKSKRKQNLLIESILLALDSQGSRFLKKDKGSSTWYEISYKEAWAKTSQALREPDERTSSGSGNVSDHSIGQAPSSPPSSRKRTSGQYTNDSPPCVDRHVFDDQDCEPKPVTAKDTEDDDKVLQQIAPALLEMNTSGFSIPESNDGGDNRPSASSWGALSYPSSHQQQGYYYNASAAVPPPSVPTEVGLSMTTAQAVGYNYHQHAQHHYGEYNSTAMPPVATCDDNAYGHAAQARAQAPPLPRVPLRMTSGSFFRDLQDVITTTDEAARQAIMGETADRDDFPNDGMAPV